MALVVFAKAEPYEGLPCFNVGWAVPDKFRRRGRAAEAFIVAANELRNDLSKHGATEF